MNRSVFLITGLMLLSSISFVHAIDPFSDPATEQRYKSLIAELRCLVCQNQSLADSNADLAVDMRREVHKMIDQGSTDEAIVQFLVDRYGDFVRYRPPVKPTTLLLWYGPFGLLLIGLITVIILVRRHQRTEDKPLSASQQEEIQSLLKEPDSDQDS